MGAYNFPWKAGCPGRGGDSGRWGCPPSVPGLRATLPRAVIPSSAPCVAPALPRLPTWRPPPGSPPRTLDLQGAAHQGALPEQLAHHLPARLPALTGLCDIDTDGGGDRELPGVPEMAPWPVGGGGHTREAPLVGDQSLEAFVRLSNPRLRLTPSCHLGREKQKRRSRGKEARHSGPRAEAQKCPLLSSRMTLGLSPALSESPCSPWPCVGTPLVVPRVSDETHILGPRLKRWELPALCSRVAGYPEGGRQQGPVSQHPPAHAQVFQRRRDGSVDFFRT